MEKPKMIIAGGSGFMGRSLVAYFASQFEIVVLSRKAAYKTSSARFVQWNGKDLGEWKHEIEGASVLLNLTGRSVNCRYTPKNRVEILNSRLDATQVLGEAIQQNISPPSLWINVASATIYKHRFDQANDEETGLIGGTQEVKDLFSIEVCEAWEHVFNAIETPQTRKVCLRTAMVLGKDKGGVMEMMMRLTRLGLGGTMGNGKQFMSWIHEQDFCRLVEWLIDQEHVSGTLNAAAPNPIPNKEFMSLLRQAMNQKIGLPASRWMLELGAVFLRTETELILKSRRVVSKRLADLGFAFQYPTAEEAFEAICKA
jgi:uncharacterized protein (TIGR01777 family)